MAVRQDRSGRWRAELKSGREYVAGRTFDTKREAEAWLSRERASLAGGVDPRAGKVLVRRAFAAWLVDREGTVAIKTTKADRSVLKAMPPGVANLHVNRVTDREVQRCINDWSRRYAESTVKRYRATLMAFFASCINERMITINPVSRTRVPAQLTPAAEMMPFSRQELQAVRDEIAAINPALADAVWLAGWTGLRWSELREVRVADFVEVPVPRLVIRRAQPEGIGTKRPKSGRSRHVPLVDAVLPLVRSMTAGKGPSDLLVTTENGARLYATAFKNTTRWAQTGRGRRLHDLRHTAACLWLEAGVSPTTVQAWMGHADLTTTQRYLHYLGTSADETGLSRLNQWGRAGGARSAGEDQ
jgi:integrase